MTDVLHLPPQEAPKLLTARQGTQNLHEHFLAFLNANNPNGFSSEEISSIGETAIVELLQRVAESKLVPEWIFKQFAKEIKRASNGAIIHNRALEIVSRVFGYNSWSEVKHHHIGADGLIQNRSKPERLPIKLFGSLAREKHE
ncbi:hypothetical protein [Herbaspirillum sp. RV1423]|uniref:hypothetical protein n=1 Tax=Herbaspirillum sp. RV1423 TaxID=1443993 RepID=UPI0012DDC49D|nr:hypothetical protein [Herbaspirillum sp. RV1423]